MPSIAERIAERFSLPKDVMMDLTKISVCGDKEVYIENHKGLAQYTNTVIRVKSKDGIITIVGDFMRIAELQPDRLTVYGELERVEYEKFGRKIKNVQKNL